MDAYTRTRLIDKLRQFWGDPLATRYSFETMSDEELSDELAFMVDEFAASGQPLTSCVTVH